MEPSSGVVCPGVHGAGSSPEFRTFNLNPSLEEVRPVPYYALQRCAQSSFWTAYAHNSSRATCTQVWPGSAYAHGC